MAELEDGNIVHASRVRFGGDLYDKVRIKNMWRKNLREEKK